MPTGPMSTKADASLLLPASPLRITRSERVPATGVTDLKGEHTVIYPTTPEEVRSAVSMAKKAGATLLFRSGTSKAHDDDDTTDATGKVVINLSGLDSISATWPRGAVTAGAGLTAEELAKKLAGGKLLLPLDCSPGKSVVSNVLGRGAAELRKTTGRLRDHVIGVEGVSTATGDPFAASQSRGPGSPELIDTILDDTDAEFVLTSITFDALTDAEARGICMARIQMLYDEAHFRSIMELFVREDVQQNSSWLDLNVRVLSGAYGIPIVQVTTACRGPEHTETMMSLMREVEAGYPEQLAKLDSLTLVRNTNVRGIMNGLRKLTAPDDLHRGEQRKTYAYERTPQNFMAFLDGTYCDAIEQALGAEGEGGHQRLPDMRASSKVSLGSDGNILVTLSLYTRQEEKGYLAAHGQLCEGLEREAEGRLVAPAVLQARGVPPKPLPSKQHVFLPETKRRPADIPDFPEVDSYRPGDTDYEAKIKQYASSSHPGVARMRPSIVAYPQDVVDVEELCTWAIANKKKVVARSGGHHYSGMSSGGEDTLLISMDYLNDLKIEGNIAKVGPGAPLHFLAQNLTDAGITIPHGECLLVNIGGHVQSGGYGHLLRSYGLALDRCKAFEVVTAIDGKVETRLIERPSGPVTPSAINEDNVNDLIYWGIMGGGPGSFGVVTEIHFDCIKDKDHTFSRGYQSIYVYSKKRWRAALEVVQNHTRMIKDGTMPPDHDLMITVLSREPEIGFSRFLNLLFVEMVYGNVDNKDMGDDVLDVPIQKIDDADWSPRLPVGVAQKSGPLWTGKLQSRREDLSYMSNTFVRNSGMTKDGREFTFPYKKRLNCSRIPVTDKFLEKFLDLTDRIVTGKDSEHVKLVYQMGLGGGAYRANEAAGITSIARRDVLFMVVFDLFYDEDGEEAAQRYQDEMEALLPEFTGTTDKDDVAERDIRMQWGTHGSVFMKEVWPLYYGRNGWYPQLQALKQRVDPTDTFTTSFTVQQPIDTCKEP
ncbi:unnamed protein product [Chrysoparadoxa australica]